jgi:hypothetical protein
MRFVRKAPTLKDCRARVEGFLVSAMGRYCMAEVAAANGYQDHTQRWRGEVERILFIDLTFYIFGATTKPAFARRQAIKAIIAEHKSRKSFHAWLSIGRKVVALRHLKCPPGELKLPDVESSRNTFWLMVSEAITYALEES